MQETEPDAEHWERVRREHDALRAFENRRLILLAAKMGLELEPIDPILDPRATGFTWWPDGETGPEIQIMAQVFNWRIAVVDRYACPLRSWCVGPRGEYGFLLTILVARAWGGQPDTPPPVYIKSYQSADPPAAEVLYGATIAKILADVTDPPALEDQEVSILDDILRRAYLKVRAPWDPSWPA